MKWMIASDIHGSAYYCRELLEAYDIEKADRLLLLGDILYHGPRNDLPKAYNPKEVITLLNQRKQDILCVRGNCDTEVDQMVLEFPVLADYCVIADEKNIIYATHGHHFNEAICHLFRKETFAEWAYPCTKMRRASGLYLYESRICFYSKRGKLAWIYDI